MPTLRWVATLDRCCQLQSTALVRFAFGASRTHFERLPLDIDVGSLGVSRSSCRLCLDVIGDHGERRASDPAGCGGTTHSIFAARGRCRQSRRRTGALDPSPPILPSAWLGMHIRLREGSVVVADGSHEVPDVDEVEMVRESGVIDFKFHIARNPRWLHQQEICAGYPAVRVPYRRNRYRSISSNKAGICGGGGMLHGPNT